MLAKSLRMPQSGPTTEVDDGLPYVAGIRSLFRSKYKTSCRRAAATICPSPPSVGPEAPRAAKPTAAPADGNVAVGSHGEYFPTLTAAAA